MLDQTITQYDAFESAFKDSPLDFSVRVGDIYLHSNEICMGNEANKDHKAVIRDNYYGHKVEDWWIVGKDYPVKSIEIFMNLYGKR